MANIAINSSLHFYNMGWGTTSQMAWISRTRYLVIIQLNLQNFKASDILTSIDFFAELGRNDGTASFITGYLCETEEDAKSVLDPTTGNQNQGAKFIQSTTGQLNSRSEFTLYFNELSILNKTKNLFVLLQANTNAVYNIYADNTYPIRVTPNFKNIGVTIETTDGFKTAIAYIDNGLEFKPVVPNVDNTTGWDVCG